MVRWCFIVLDRNFFCQSVRTVLELETFVNHFFIFVTVSCKAALLYLGPLLFLLFFINDIIDCLSKIHNQVVCKLYADDVKLYTPTELRPTDDNFFV